MVDREPVRGALRRALLGFLLVNGCGAPAPKLELSVGSPAPPALAASNERAVRATWVFGGGDLLRCRNSARELRHLQARFGDRLEVAAVAFDADRNAVESFLRYQRVRAPVRHLASNHAVAARGLVFPALYLTRGDTVVGIYPGVPREESRSANDRNVESTIASLLGAPGQSRMASQ